MCSIHVTAQKLIYLLFAPPPPQGDKMYGRGTTDCLGHVALITDIFLQLAEKKPKLKFKVVSVFIAR